jgi:hypothetical protein
MPCLGCGEPWSSPNATEAALSRRWKGSSEQCNLILRHNQNNVSTQTTHFTHHNIINHHQLPHLYDQVIPGGHTRCFYERNLDFWSQVRLRASCLGGPSRPSGRVNVTCMDIIYRPKTSYTGHNVP